MVSPQIQNALNQLDEAQRNLQLRKQEATTTQQQLLRANQNLPNLTTQMKLRVSPGINPLAQQVKRQQTEIARGKIQEGLKQVQGYTDQLTNYENTQIKPFEAQVREAQAREEAFNLARKLYEKRIPYNFTEGYVREYLRQFYRNQPNLILKPMTGTITTTKPDILGFKVTDYGDGSSVLTQTRNGQVVSQIGRIGFQETKLPQLQSLNLESPTANMTTIEKVGYYLSGVPETNYINKLLGLNPNQTQIQQQNEALRLKLSGGQVNTNNQTDPFQATIFGTNKGFQPQPEYQSGAKFSFRYAPSYIGRQLVEKNVFGLGTAENRTTEKFPALKELSQVAGPTIAEIPTFQFFGPAISSGTSATQESAYVEVRDAQGNLKGYKLKSDLPAQEQFANLKEYLNKLDKNQLKDYAQKTIDDIKSSQFLTESEKQANLLRLKATIIEAKTGTKLITESGNVDINTLNQIEMSAVSKPTPKTQIIIDVSEMARLPQMEQIGTLMSSTYFKSYQPQERFATLQPTSKFSTQSFSTLQKLDTLQKTKEKEKQLFSLSSLSSTSQIQKPRQDIGQINIPRERYDTRTGIDVVQRVIPRTNQPTKQRTGQDEIFYPRLRQLPREDPLKIKLPNLSNKKKVQKPFYKKVKKDLFFAVSRRYGREKVVASGFNPNAVAEQGKRYVKETLGASLKLRNKSGREFLLNPGKDFSISKRDPYRIVQNRRGNGGRLGSLGERREIQSLRMRKKFKLF